MGSCPLHAINEEVRLTDRLPTLFIPHGGGPCFFMDWGPNFPADMWDSMAAFLRSLDEMVGRRPKCVLVISGHWETTVPNVMSVEQNTLLYDYNGFPAHTYQLAYPAAGSPAVAVRVQDLLEQAGFDCQMETKRGLDHGVFVPFLLIYPEADVPIVQLSLPLNASVGDLMSMGEALAPLRDEDVLIVGSGMTYHNIAGILGRIGGQTERSARFDAWLGDALALRDRSVREQALEHWLDAPFASDCHPTPEHLLPLFVVAGAGDRAAGERVYNAPTLGNLQSAFRFGATPDASVSCEKDRVTVS